MATELYHKTTQPTKLYTFHFVQYLLYYVHTGKECLINLLVVASVLLYGNEIQVPEKDGIQNLKKYLIQGVGKELMNTEMTFLRRTKELHKI